MAPAALPWPVQRARFAGAGNAGVIDPDGSSRDLPRTVVAMHAFTGVHEAKRLAAEGERLPLVQIGRGDVRLTMAGTERVACGGYGRFSGSDCQRNRNPNDQKGGLFVGGCERANI